MAFEPLRTDEKLEKPVRPEADMDSQMLAGCTGFVLISVLGYILAVWPFFAFQNAEKLATLGLCAAAGMLPAAILGVVGTRKFGLPGATGFVAGSLTTGVFLYLRLQQAIAAGVAQQAPEPDWPPALLQLFPLAWILTAAILAMLALPKDPQNPA